MIFVDASASAVPILVLAWLIRKATGTLLTKMSAIWSVLAAGVVGYVIRSFMEGEGGFAARVSNIAAMSVNTLVALFLGTLIAAILAFLVAKGRGV